MKDLNELTPQAIVLWFRQQATKYNQMADYLESNLAGGSPQMPSNGAAVFNVPKSREFTPENVRAAVKKRGMRRSDVAAMFHVSIEDVDSLIEKENSGLAVSERAGWIQAND
jgi:hypothetical protein